MGINQLPKFTNPPVVETAMGVEFSPLDRFAIPHFGSYWATVKERFPRFEVQPPLASHIEDPDSVFKKEPQVIRVGIGGPPSVRCWFIDQSDSKLIQVQNNRFILNWRKRATPYPSFEVIKPEFERELRGLMDFVAANQIGAIDVVQCELTYINHIAIGQGWESVADFPDVFPFLSSQVNRQFLPTPENINFELSFKLPERKGRLTISENRVIRKDDGLEAIQLKCVTRGCPANPAIDGVLAWLDLGHEWAVKGFADFTSPKLHDAWGRTL